MNETYKDLLDALNDLVNAGIVKVQTYDLICKVVYVYKFAFYTTTTAIFSNSSDNLINKLREYDNTIADMSITDLPLCCYDYDKQSWHYDRNAGAFVNDGCDRKSFSTIAEFVKYVKKVVADANAYYEEYQQNKLIADIKRL